MITQQKVSNREKGEGDVLDAFVAMGGKADKSGEVDASRLIDIIKTDFEMTINIEKLIGEIDEDGSGKIEYAEFM